MNRPRAIINISRTPPPPPQKKKIKKIGVCDDVWTNIHPLPTIDVTRHQWVNTLKRFRIQQFQMHFINENVWISIKISLNLFHRIQLAIFQRWFRKWFFAWLAPSQYLNQWWLDYRRVCLTRPHWVKAINQNNTDIGLFLILIRNCEFRSLLWKITSIRHKGIRLL